MIISSDWSSVLNEKETVCTSTALRHAEHGPLYLEKNLDLCSDELEDTTRALIGKLKHIQNFNLQEVLSTENITRTQHANILALSATDIFITRADFGDCREDFLPLLRERYRNSKLEPSIIREMLSQLYTSRKLTWQLMVPTSLILSSSLHRTYADYKLISGIFASLEEALTDVLQYNTDRAMVYIGNRLQRLAAWLKSAMVSFGASSATWIRNTHTTARGSILSLIRNGILQNRNSAAVGNAGGEVNGYGAIPA